MSMTWQDSASAVHDYRVFCDGQDVTARVERDLHHPCEDCLVFSKWELIELGFVAPPESWMDARRHLKKMVSELIHAN